MRILNSPITWGLALVGAGVLFLLQNLGVLGPFDNIGWTILVGLAGVLFLGAFVGDVNRWWALIPGLTLLGLAALIGLGDASPELAERLGGPLFLGAIGLSFWLVYLTHREHWWAVIPGGVLLTLAAVAAVPNRVSGFATGGLFFLGVALTFGLLYVLPTPQGRMDWAVYPAAASLALGVLVLIGAGGVMGYLWPAVLIGAGLLLVVRAMRARSN